MDFLNGKIKTLYFKYLAAAFGSALVTSIYSIVDMAMVGKYHGPAGTAALAVVAPVWNIIYSLGLLMGIGGSVLFSTIRGKGEGETRRSNEYFTVSMAGSLVLALAAWAAIACWDQPLLQFFGAEWETLTLAREYVRPIKFVIPCFLFTQTLAAYLRNDRNPALATAGVLAGGIFNVFGDYFFVFTCDMGAFGAGLATAIGTVISILVMSSHFFLKKNTLRLVRPTHFFGKLREISVTGFSTFFIDIAMGILTILFNRQIMAYLGTNALSVYGVIVNISTFVQCCAYSVGQASQPILSTNFGAGKGQRIRQTLRYALAQQPFLDSALPCSAQLLYSPVYGPYTAGFGNCPNDYSVLQPVLPAAAFEYFFHLLLPGSYEAENSLCGFYFAWADYQRHSDSSAAGSFRREFHLVRHAAYRVRSGNLCCVHDCPLYKAIISRKEGNR